MRRIGAALALAAAAASWAPGAAEAGRSPANRCQSLASVAAHRFVTGSYAADGATSARALGFFFKPTGPGTYLLYDSAGKLLSVTGGDAVAPAGSPGPDAEWALQRRARASFVLRSTATGRVLAVDSGSRALVTAPADAAGRSALFLLVPARRCRAYPEAELDATGRPFRGRRHRGVLFGFADAHLHITADLRAGGRVLSGESFDRFGITEALGHDADVHGRDGSLDVTGNLLRSGQPTGTHDTAGWPGFTGWPTYDTYTHQQVYYRWLERVWLAGMRLVVAQTIEDEPLCKLEPIRSHSCDETETVELQIARLRALQDYADAQSGGPGRGWFRLVYTPREARRAIERGKLAVIIGVESSDPFGCSELRGRPNCDQAAIDRGIARLLRDGVRSLFVAHWVDNALAGAALEGGAKGTFIAAMELAQTGQPFKTGPCPQPGQGEEVQPAVPEALGPVVGASPEPLPVYPAGPQCNARGLTDLGAYAVRKLMDAHMLIEVDHLSEWAREQVLAMAEARHYPLVSSHTGTGGAWTPSDLRRLYALGGFATATIDEASKLRDKILALRTYAGRRFYGVGIGTDTGGFNALPAPEDGPGHAPLRYPFRSYDGHVVFARQRTGERTFDLNRDGVAHYGLLPDLLADMQRQKDGREAMSLLFRSAEAYLRTWQRTGA